MNKEKLWKFLVVALLFSGQLLFPRPGEASEDGETEKYNIIPIGAYSYVSLGTQIVNSPGLALALQSQNSLYVGSYIYNSFEEELLFDVPEDYHRVNFLGDIHRGPLNTLLIFRSESDEPVSGGLRTFQLGTAIGYDLHFGSSSSFILGGGLAVSDFGVDLPDGRPMPVIPVPLIRYSNKGKVLNISFDFLTGPNLSTTLAPESKIRITSDMRMNRFRDAGDIIFE